MLALAAGCGVGRRRRRTVGGRHEAVAGREAGRRRRLGVLLVYGVCLPRVAWRGVTVQRAWAPHQGTIARSRWNLWDWPSLAPERRLLSGPATKGCSYQTDQIVENIGIEKHPNCHVYHIMTAVIQYIGSTAPTTRTIADGE